ncbi:MAG: fatty acid desaturase [Bryobacteraceae bacterium]
MSFLWMLFITLAILQVSVLCTTIYLHRTLAHKGLHLHPAVALLMHLHLCLFTGLVPREWVAVHRKHHAFSDEEGDPHSPYLLGLWGVFFLNAFYYRRTTHEETTVGKYTTDMKDDIIDRIPYNHLGTILGMAIFVTMFGWAWGLGLFAFHAVTYILLNSSINSLGHMIGYRTFRNKATNLQWLALMTGGEGLHNNHHEYPGAARFAMTKGEFDPAWLVIRALELLGLARVLRLPAAKAA